MGNTHVTITGQSAVLSYERNIRPKVNDTDAENEMKVLVVPETRIWQLIDGFWKHVHFHRG
jgi:hypothetical protein